jgi:hypothetical protein
MKLEANPEELALLLDFLAEAGAEDQLPSGLLPFFWRLSALAGELPPVPPVLFLLPLASESKLFIN